MRSSYIELTCRKCSITRRVALLWKVLKGQLIFSYQVIFLFNLSRNIVALQFERVVARIMTACSTCHATSFSIASWDNMSRKVVSSSTFCNNFFQLATLKCVAWKIEHAVLIQAITLFNLQCNNVAQQVERKCCP